MKMTSRLIDLTNKVFDNGTVVLRRVSNAKTGAARWKCRCSCKRVFIRNGDRLNNGATLCTVCTQIAKMKRLGVGQECKHYGCTNKVEAGCGAECRCCFVGDAPYESAGLQTNLSAAF